MVVKPFVKLYRRRDVRRLFARFDIADVSTHKLTAEHFYPPALGRFLRPVLPKLEGLMGWYIVCLATKPR